MNSYNNGNVPPDAGHALVQLDPEQQRQLALLNAAAPAAFFEEEEGVDLKKYWRTLYRHKITIFVIVLVALVATAITTSMETPFYRSTATIQIEQDDVHIMDYQGALRTARNQNDYYQTQYELLKSRKLARSVVEKLGLESSSPLEVYEKKSFFGDLLDSLRALFAPENVVQIEEQAVSPVTDSTGADPDIANAETSKPKDTSRIERMLIANLRIIPVKNSRLVNIQYSSANPKLAAEVANAVASSFIEMSLGRRAGASSYAKDFLTERIAQIRKKLEESEVKLVKFSSARSIIDYEHNLKDLIGRADELNQRLGAIETIGIQARAQLKALNVGESSNYDTIRESRVIQAYKQSLAELETEYEEKLRIFKPDYPKMVQLRGQIDGLKQKIESEIIAIEAEAKLKLESAANEESALRTKLANLKTHILELKQQGTEYQVLKRDVETNRELYNGLLQRLKELDVTVGVGADNITIIDKAEPAHAPYSPDLQKNLQIALILGLIGGIGLAFLFESLDDTVKSTADLEKLTGLPVLGVIPDSDDLVDEESSLALQTFENPTSHLSESYRSLRTALSFSTTGGSPDILHVTSSVAGEGKTTTAISLATVYTQAGSNVLIIDADLRNPSLHKELYLPNETGLTNILAGGQKASQIVQKTRIPKLWALPSGPIPPNPAELLGSGKMMDLVSTASERFDMVIVDSAPILGLADALVLGNLADAVVLVVDSTATRKGVITGALQRLRQVRANVIGTIFTKYGQQAGGYGSDYNYNYHYSYGADRSKKSEAMQEA